MTSTDQILPILWRRRWSVAATFVVVLGVVAAITFQLPKVYVASSYLLVTPDRPASTDFETAQVSKTLTETYGKLLQTRNVADEVQGALGPRAGGGYVGDNISVETGDTQLLKISAEGGTPLEARVIANTYADTFERHTERFRRLIPGLAAHVIVAEYAQLPVSPARPRPKLYLLIGALLAALAAVGMGLLRQRLDRHLEIRDSDTEVLGLPVIARIPTTGRDLWPWGVARKATAGMRSDARLAEAFRLLLVNVSFANLGEQPRSVAIVSSSEREGKSSCVLGLARAASETGRRTLAVDADLRRPSLASKLGVASQFRVPGLASFLAGTHSEVSMTVPGEAFDVMLSGPIPPNPAALLASRGFEKYHDHATSVFDLVLYDTPPLSIAADASLVAAKVGGVILVVDATKTRRKAAAQAIDQLTRSKVNLLGVVLNRAPDLNQDSYYYKMPAPAKGPSDQHERELSSPAS